MPTKLTLLPSNSCKALDSNGTLRKRHTDAWLRPEAYPYLKPWCEGRMVLIHKREVPNDWVRFLADDLNRLLG